MKFRTLHQELLIIQIRCSGNNECFYPKQILGILWKSGEAVQAVVEREGLRQVSDAGTLDPVIEKIIAGFPRQAEDFRAGKDKLLGFFVGQVMKETAGKANPAMLNELIKKKLGAK